MSYAICRIQKCGSSHDIAGVQIHNRRERTHSNSNPDIDFERSKDNYNLCSRSDGKTFNATVDEIIEKEYTSSRAIRKDAVKMCEVLFTSDNDFFINKSSSEQRAFFEDCYRWAAERWGESRILSATVHLDEQTPHMHLCFVPLAETVNKKTGEVVTTLNAHKAVGSGSKAIQQLQDNFYQAIGKQYGLDRGNRSDLENGEQPRKNQRVEEYKNTTQYYQQQQDALQATVQALQATQATITDILHTEPQNVIQSVPVPFVAKLALGKKHNGKVLVSPEDMEQLQELIKANYIKAAALESRGSDLDKREQAISEREEAEKNKPGIINMKLYDREMRAEKKEQINWEKEVQLKQQEDILRQKENEFEDKAAQGPVGYLRNTIATAEQTIREYKQLTQQLSAKSEQQQTEIDSLNRQMNKEKSNFTNLQGQNSSLSERVRVLEDELNAKEQLLSEKEKKIESLNKKIDSSDNLYNILYDCAEYVCNKIGYDIDKVLDMKIDGYRLSYIIDEGRGRNR